MTGRAWSCMACVMACVPLLQVAAYPRPVSAQSVPLAMPQDTRLVVFRYDPNDSYLLLTRPGAVTHIALEPDESVVALALGDTVQWIVQDKGPNVFVKPVRPDLYTSGTLVTNRRTYQLGLRSSPEGGAWYQRVSWTFPGLIALARESDGRDPRGAAPAAQPGLGRSAAEGVRIERLNFDYRITGRAAFRPAQVLDDGRFTYIQMPVSLQEMPALFVAGESGEGERVNYLVRGRFLVVQRLADRLLLRLGRAQVSVERLQPLDGPNEAGLPARPFPDGASQ
ncbi:MAG: TrbG/VirB9 family P-type conjugative transfer protein [Pseudomonadota bacterium]